VQRFPILFSSFNRAMILFGFVPSRCRVEVDHARVRVHMGWAFRMEADLANVTSAQNYDRRVWSWGVHGWRGRWLVNGSGKGLVRITFASPVPARMALWPLKVRELTVSVVDREGLRAALGT
jgi:hypothetical protein